MSGLGKWIGGFCLGLAVAGLHAGALDAEMTPFQWSFYPPVQLFTAKTMVSGLRLNTGYGNNTQVNGIDVGICGGAEKVRGLQVGILSAATMEMSGAQVGLCNFTGREDLVKTGKANGAQVGWVNASQSDFAGAQVGVANLSSNGMYGAQVGFINHVDDSNAVRQGNCFQFGVLNFNKSGFLPFFILFNF